MKNKYKIICISLGTILIIFSIIFSIKTQKLKQENIYLQQQKIKLQNELEKEHSN